MTDTRQPIPHRLRNISKEHPYVAGAIDIVDDADGRNQQDINADTYRKGETYSKEQLNNMITTPEQKYENYTAEDGDTFSDLGLPAEGEADTTYRVGCWDGTEYNASKFTEYSWDGTQYIPLSVQSPGIDDEPTAGSSNLVESGGVYENLLPVVVSVSSRSPKPVLEVTDGYIIGTTGNSIANSAYAIVKYECNQKQKYRVSVYKRSSASGAYHVNWFNASDELIFHEIPFEAEESGAVTVTCQAPEGASYCLINSHEDYLGYVSFSLLDGTVDSSLLQLATMQIYNPNSLEYVAPSSVSIGKSYANWQESSNQNYNVLYYPVEGGEYYVVNTLIGHTNAFSAIWWFASGDKPVCAEPIAGSPNYVNHVVRAPEGAVKVAINLVNGSDKGANLAKIKDNQLPDYEMQNAMLTASVSKLEVLQKDDTIADSFINSNGTVVSNQNFEIWLYEVDPSKLYTFSGKYRNNTTINFMGFLDAEQGFLCALPFKGSSVNVVYTDIGVSVPNNASYIFLNVRKGLEPYFNVKKVVGSLPVRDIEKINDIDNALADYDNAVYDSVTDGNVILENGNELAVSSGEYYEYAVIPGEKYRIKTRQSSGWSGVDVYILEDNDGNVLGYGPHKQQGEVEDFDEIVVIPDDVTKLIVNNDKRQSLYYSVGIYTGYVDVGELKETVESLTNETKGDMKVVITNFNSGFYIRTRYNDSKDIIITHWINKNGLVSFDSTYIGDRELSDSEITKNENKISSHTDSTSPIRGYTQYWHLFAQHGYPVPYIANPGMTSADIGASWKDQLDRYYTIGKVTESYIWLLPVIYQDANGHYTRDWQSLATSAAITELTPVSGGSYSSDITVDTVNQEQLQPIMEVRDRTWIADGKVITGAGTYYCNDFCVSETELGYDPATISDWFGGENGKPDLTGAQVMAEFTYSYSYKGAQCSVNTTIHFLREGRGRYGGTQQQFFFDTGDYKAMFMLPKAATVGGVELDKPFASPSASSPLYELFRSATYLKDVDDIVDRQIGMLYDDDNDSYLIGMAAGLSLINGDTVKAKRNANIPLGNSVLRFSPSNINKFYVVAFNPSLFQSGYYPPGYFKELNYYVSYFDPAQNVGQVYWYKEGNSYVIYAHCQSTHHALAVNVPKFMDGLSLSVVEKTSDAELLTDTVSNGKFFVNYNTNDANYIVLKTK